MLTCPNKEIPLSSLDNRFSFYSSLCLSLENSLGPRGVVHTVVGIKGRILLLVQQVVHVTIGPRQVVDQHTQLLLLNLSARVVQSDDLPAGNDLLLGVGRPSFPS